MHHDDTKWGLLYGSSAMGITFKQIVGSGTDEQQQAKQWRKPKVVCGEDCNKKMNTQEMSGSTNVGETNQNQRNIVV